MRLPRRHPHVPVLPPPKRDPRIQLDRHRQDETLVVVRVIADQVNSPGRPSHLHPRRVGTSRKFGFQGID